MEGRKLGLEQGHTTERIGSEQVRDYAEASTAFKCRRVVVGAENWKRVALGYSKRAIELAQQAIERTTIHVIARIVLGVRNFLLLVLRLLRFQLLSVESA